MGNNNFCPGCGSKLSEGAHYCFNCGSEITRTTEKISTDNISLSAAKSNQSVVSIKGRIPRKTYRKYTIIIILLLVVMPWVMNMAGNNFSSFLTVFVILIAVTVMAGAVATFYWMSIKRFHDLNRSGWNTLLLLIPFYGFYLFRILLHKEGTDGPNNYGANN